MAKVLTISTSGKIEEVDIATGGGGGLNLVSSNAVIDFGNENNSAFITVNSAVLTNANILGCTFIPQDTAETSLEDFSLNGVSFSIQNIVNNVSFDVVGTATNEASGNYTVKYLITY
jgi:hypothetical protein